MMDFPDYVPETVRAYIDAYAAFGSGRDFAMGAMASGANAEMAVRAAITHCISCGGLPLVFDLAQ